VLLPFYTLAVTVMAWSNPLSLLALPICVLQLAINKRWPQRFCLLICIGAILSYQVFGVNHGSHFELSLDSITWACKVFLARVPFESVFGAHATTLLMANGGALFVYGLGATVLCLASLTILVGQQSIQRLSFTAAAILLTFAIVFISTLVRYTGEEARLILLTQPYLQRYFYVPKLIFVFTILTQVVPRFKILSWGKRPSVITTILASCFLYLITVNVDNAFLYNSSEKEGRQIAHFLNTVSEDLRRARNGRDYVAEHKLERPGKWEKWDIILKIDQYIDRTTSPNEALHGEAATSTHDR